MLPTGMWQLARTTVAALGTRLAHADPRARAIAALVLVATVLAWRTVRRERRRRQHDEVSRQIGSSLLRSAAQWRDMAVQDQNPLVALQHAVSAQTYARAARAILSDVALERLGHVDVRALVRQVDDIVDASCAAIAKRSKLKKDQHSAATQGRDTDSALRIDRDSTFRPSSRSLASERGNG